MGMTSGATVAMSLKAPTDGVIRKLSLAMLPHGEKCGRFLHRSQRDDLVATEADFCTAVLKC